MQVVMDSQHPDSAAIERVGRKAIMEHFDLSGPGVSMWKKRGVPSGYRRPLALLGKLMGHKMPEMPDVEIPNAG